MGLPQTLQESTEFYDLRKVARLHEACFQPGDNSSLLRDWFSMNLKNASLPANTPDIERFQEHSQNPGLWTEENYHKIKVSANFMRLSVVPKNP